MTRNHVEAELNELIAAAYAEALGPYIEAVASTVQGKPNGQAWADFQTVLTKALVLTQMLGLAVVVEDAEKSGVEFEYQTKKKFAKSDCGANAEGGGGFQPGNTCSGDGDGQAESGESRHKTSTPEFKTWFGDSKVVDKNGEPLVVHHGTSAAFDEFDDERSIGGQHWFTDNKSLIEKGEVGASGTGTIMSLYLSLKNPAGWDEYDKYTLDELIGKGYDGLMLDEDDQTTYVAFSPTQIKSATENTGSFDPNNPKITHAKNDCGANAEGGGGFQPGNTCAGDGDGKSESGESSHATSTPEFKSWFGDSKVVDDDGQPLEMYHGTGKSEGFDEFKPEMTGLGADQLGSGFYFTTDPEEASSYTTRLSAVANPSDAKLGGDNSPGVLPVYLSIQNPLEVKGSNLRDVDIDLTPSQAESIIRYSPDLFHPDDSPIGNWHDIWDAGLQEWMITDVSANYAGPSFMSIENDFFRGNSTAFRNALYEVLGYDGVVQDFDGKKHYVAWFPNQIKSSLGNTGAFDPDDPKITHAKDTFAKDDWPLEAEAIGLEVSPYEEAIELFEERIPMARDNAVQLAKVAENQALEIAQAERLTVVSKLDAQSGAMRKAIETQFWVSDVEDQSAIKSFRDLIAESMRGVNIDNVLSMPEFIEQATVIAGPEFVERLGGQQDAVAARLETVFRTNLSTAFNQANAAAYRSSDVQDIAPLIMLTEINDNRSRPHHAAMDGYVNTSVYFDTKNIHPPNGYNCRGGTRIVTWSEAERMGFVSGENKLDWDAIKKHNQGMQPYLDSGEYPDPGFSLLPRVA
mgnify:CR=1 FL=1